MLPPEGLIAGPDGKPPDDGRDCWKLGADGRSCGEMARDPLFPPPRTGCPDDWFPGNVPGSNDRSGSARRAPVWSDRQVARAVAAGVSITNGRSRALRAAHGFRGRQIAARDRAIRTPATRCNLKCSSVSRLALRRTATRVRHRRSGAAGSRPCRGVAGDPTTRGVVRPAGILTSSTGLKRSSSLACRLDQRLGRSGVSGRASGRLRGTRYPAGGRDSKWILTGIVRRHDCLAGGRADGTRNARSPHLVSPVRVAFVEMAIVVPERVTESATGSPPREEAATEAEAVAKAKAETKSGSPEGTHQTHPSRR